MALGYSAINYTHIKKKILTFFFSDELGGVDIAGLFESAVSVEDSLRNFLRSISEVASPSLLPAPPPSTAFSAMDGTVYIKIRQKLFI